MALGPYAALEAKLGYEFGNPHLLRVALSHTTYRREHAQPSQEDFARLAFLGDAVVELAVRASLIEQEKSAPPGELSKATDEVVTNASLAQLARHLDLGSWIELGTGEKRSGGRDKEAVLTDAMEAIAGAIYLDCTSPADAVAVAGRLMRSVNPS